MKKMIASSGERIARNLFSLITGNVISQILVFLSVIYLARVLKAEGFGKVAFAQGILAYFLLFSDLGLKTFGTIKIAKGKRESKKYVNNIVTMRVVLSIISFLLLLLTVWMIDKPQQQKYLIILFGVSIFPSAIMLDWFFQGIERMGIIGITNTLKSLIFIILLFLFLESQSLLYVPVYFLFSSVLAMIPMLSVFIKENGLITPSFKSNLWKESLTKALPLGFSSIMIQVYYNIDTVMLGFMKGDEAVGFYNAAYKIVLLLIGLAGITVMVFLPIVSRMYEESKENLLRYLRYLSKITIFWGIPVAVGGMILSEKIIKVFYGEYYNSSVLPLQILIWSVFTVFSNIPFALILLVSEKGKEYMYSVTAGAIVNISLNLFLIPRFNLTGASIATLISEFIVLSLLFLYAKGLFSIPVFKNIFISAVSSLVMGIGLINVQSDLNLTISVLSGIFIYLLSLIILKGISKDDLIFIRQEFRIKGFNAWKLINK